jgi:hypothetical protein
MPGSGWGSYTLLENRHASQEKSMIALGDKECKTSL